jgi:hypothetical protein
MAREIAEIAEITGAGRMAVDVYFEGEHGRRAAVLREDVPQRDLGYYAAISGFSVEEAADEEAVQVWEGRLPGVHEQW